MRFFLLILVVASTALLAPTFAGAETTRSVELHARVIDYYSNRFILTADGNVRARLSDGTVVSGETFSIDLKLNRFLIAGNVHIDGPKIHAAGAALAGYPDLERFYFLPEGGTPDRWTYYGLDFTDTHPGRLQPGDAFDFPDLSGQRPYIISNSATIFLKNNVEFPPGSRISVMGVYMPTPGYVINYSSNPNFYQNAFAGAVFDVGIPYHGAADAISAFHLRYSQYQGGFLAFDQHFVHNLDYAVLSVNPLTQNQRQWNAILYKRLSPDVEARLFYQLSEESIFLNEPVTASSYSNFSINTRIGRYAVGLNADLFNNDLLGGAQNAYNPANGLDQAAHPFDMTLNVQSFENEWRLFRYIGVPLKFQYRAGYGFNYNSYGVPTIEPIPPGGTTFLFGGAEYPSIWNTYVGASVYTASIKLAKLLSISAQANGLINWYSLPHDVTQTSVSTTLAYTPTLVKLPAYLLSYTVLSIGDNYRGAQQQAYPSTFDGYATSRVLSGSIVYAPTPYFALNLTAQYTNQSPASVPFVGGAPPYQFNADMRVRINPHLLVDIARSYYFNWSNELWSPQYTIQFSP